MRLPRAAGEGAHAAGSLRPGVAVGRGRSASSLATAIQQRIAHARVALMGLRSRCASGARAAGPPPHPHPPVKPEMLRLTFVDHAERVWRVHVWRHDDRESRCSTVSGASRGAGYRRRAPPPPRRRVALSHRRPRACYGIPMITGLFVQPILKLVDGRSDGSRLEVTAPALGPEMR